MNLFSIQHTLQSEDDYKKLFVSLRWPDGVKCVHCNHNHVYHKSNPGEFKCAKCRSSFSVTSGTIFHSTKLPLRKWLSAFAQIVAAKKGISSLQLARSIDVNKNTAWFIQFRIRLAMKSQPLLYGRFSQQIKRWKYETKIRQKLKQVYLDKKQRNKISPTPELTTNLSYKRSFHFTTGKEFKGLFSTIERAFRGQYHRLSYFYLPYYLMEIRIKMQKPPKDLFYHLLTTALI